MPSFSTNKKRKSTTRSAAAAATKKQKKLNDQESSPEEQDKVKKQSTATQKGKKNAQETTNEQKNKRQTRTRRTSKPSIVEHDSESDQDSESEFETNEQPTPSDEFESSEQQSSSDDDFQSPPPTARSKLARNKKVEKNKKKKQHSEEEDFEPESSTTPTKTEGTTVSISIPEGAPFPDALAPEVLQFLIELKDNNCREFMIVNEKRWKVVRKDFMDFIKMISEQLHEIDPTVLIEEPRWAMYRQHRDLRFTNDLIPYKNYMSAYFSRGGKKSPFAGYYLEVQPNGKSYVAAGIWQPEAPRLQRIRAGIMENADILREALTLPIIKETFGQDGVSILSNQDKLKVAPKNVARDHPEIELLRFKSFAISKSFTDEDVLSAGFLDKVLDVYEALVPFVNVLNAWGG